MNSASAAVQDSRGWLRLDPLGVLIAVIAGAGSFLPFAVFKANRIVPGDGVFLWDALPPPAVVAFVIAVGAALAAALTRAPALAKLWTSAVALVTVMISVGLAANALAQPDQSYARVSIGGGFWLVGFALALMLTDALARRKLLPTQRLGLLAVSLTLVAALLWSGAWNELSILKEYQSRAPAFWQEARTHVLLALASVAVAVAMGVPLGIVGYKIERIRRGTLGLLNVIQTIPSIALFGMLIVPLAWVAATVPGARAAGISGIGTAPAMVALVAYALLPVVANTLVGLTGLPAATVEAARGMGMSSPQRLMQVELPLALPVILTGIRIVLVQNIGLATIAALIGGGGFGVFVFQGIGQTAADLVLLGAVPTVVLAFVAAVILDSLIEISAGRMARA